MKPTLRVIARLLGVLALGLSAVRAADSPTGTIEGRVLNASTGEYLERARVSLDGTDRTTFTDETGRYVFAAVGAGPAQVRVFFTGRRIETAAVTVVAGQVATHDFELADLAAPGAARDVVKLSRFVVATSRELDGAAIAINEKRFAADIRDVIAADEFGPMADGNVGELLKHVPGVALDYVGGAAMNISLHGVPAGLVPVTMNGFPLASTTASSPTGRDVELVNVATNNLARIEVLHSPVPESPGHALAGSVNMVPRSAFERAKPHLEAHLYALLRDDMRTLGRTPGPTLGATRKVLPGFDFSYVAPVNARFGFTLSGGTSQQYQPTYFVQANWRGVSAATNATTFPATTPDRPYLTDYLVRDQPRQSRRTAAGVTIDWKLTATDRLNVSLQLARFDAQYNQRDLTFAITRVAPGDFSTAFTHGAAGAGTLTLANANDRDRRNANISPSLLWRHRGPIWQAEGGAGWSLSTSEIRDQGKGFFNTVNATRTGVTIAFDDIFYLRPGRITVTDGATGAAVDPYKVATYRLQTAGGNRYGTDSVLGPGPGEGLNNRTVDVARNAFVNARRSFALRVPLTLKAGLDVRQAIRDYRGGATAYTFVGPDGVANSADDTAAPYLDPVYSARDGVFGFPRTERIGGGLLYDAFRRNPAMFVKNDNTIYRSAITLSKRAEEVVSSAFLRADTALLDRRLRLMGGFRVEQTNIDAAGPLTDPTGNYRRDSAGRFIDANPAQPGFQPSLIVPITDALGVSRLTFLDRGYRARKEYLNVLPRFNASYALRENLIVRAAYSHALGRPNYNQYAGGLTLPDESLPPSPGNRITVNNVALKPWTARTVQFSIERYFEGVGLVSAGAFRRDYRNVAAAVVLPSSPGFLASYDVDPAVYGVYDVVTQVNIPSGVRSEGFDVSYKQALTFLPGWARGVQVFANGAVTRFTGEAADNFQAFIPKTASWGVSLNREKYTLKASWNYKSRHRRAAITGASIPPGTYVFGSKRLFIDLIGEYRLTRRLALFGNIRNLHDTPEDFSRDGPGIPDVAKFRQRDRYGALWMFGVKGTF
ncbi:MAG: TonB-dependent receptor [Verrucomicrobia bacterium]|nr:TonB-dependent receptor [Verrucomicrobiota bacterium]